MEYRYIGWWLKFIGINTGTLGVLECPKWREGKRKNDRILRGEMGEWLKPQVC